MVRARLDVTMGRWVKSRRDLDTVVRGAQLCNGSKAGAALFVWSCRQNLNPGQPPGSCKKRKDGHPQWEWCTQRSLKVAIRPRSLDFFSNDIVNCRVHVQGSAPSQFVKVMNRAVVREVY